MTTMDARMVDLQYLDPKSDNVMLLARILEAPATDANLDGFKAEMAEHGVRLGILLDPDQVQVVRDPMKSVELDLDDFEIVGAHPTADLFEHARLGSPRPSPAFEQQARQWLSQLATSWFDSILPDAAPDFIPSVVGLMIDAPIRELRG